MAKIRKIYDQTIKPDGSKTTIYPITSTRAVYTPEGETLDSYLKDGYFHGADLRGYKTVSNVTDLSTTENQFGWLIGEDLYVWVGTGGDTLGGLYQNCGHFRTPYVPDDEDLVADPNNELKLKDRTVEDGGMGYVILRKNKSFAEQVGDTNTIYEIRYDFDLSGEDVTIPAGCVLSFNGGSVSNGTIDLNGAYINAVSKHFIKSGANVIFKNGENDEIPFSWFENVDVCQSNIYNFAAKWLVIDEDITITTPFMLDRKVIGDTIKIKGSNRSNREEQSTVTCDGCSFGVFYATNAEVCNMRFLMKGNQEQSAIIFKCSSPGHADIDCIIRECVFRGDSDVVYGEGNIAAIEVWGRGVLIENNTFTYPNTSKALEIDEMKKFNILLTPVVDVFPDVQGHDVLSAMRAHRIIHNRMHGPRDGGYMIGVLKNPDCPDYVFNDMYIEGNYLDIGASLLYMQCKNKGTNIIGNQCGPRYAHPAIRVANAENMLIANNVLRSISESYYFTHYSDLLDVSFIFEGDGDAIEGVTISNNILGAWNGSITATSEVEDGDFVLKNIIITGNSYTNEGFERSGHSLAFTRAILQPSVSVNGAIIKGNTAPRIEDTQLPFAIGLNNETSTLTNIIIEDNINFSNCVSQFSSGYIVPILDLDGVDNRPLVTNRSGTFANKPTVSANRITIGFEYFCTDKQTAEGEVNGIMIYHKGSDVWVDALGRVVE